MADLTTYALADGIATITMDDGKVNALSPAMLGELAAHLDQAERDDAVVVLTGRPGRFSAGFDLRVPEAEWGEMMIAGAEVAARLLDFPRPVVAACSGHAIAMGAFLLLAVDARVGVAGDAQIGLNEVAIGMTMPAFGVALARYRLTPPYFDRCVVTSEPLSSQSARDAGFLDAVVAPEALAATAGALAEQLKGLDPAAHAATKRRVRAETLAGVQAGIARIRLDEKPW